MMQFYLFSDSQLSHGVNYHTSQLSHGVAIDISAMILNYWNMSMKSGNETLNLLDTANI